MSQGKIYTTWVWRGFVPYPGWDDPLDTKHKQQAGPNGAENNHDICYAYSDDGGVTWYNNADKKIGDLKIGEAVNNTSEGVVVFEIPKGRGLTNQESQAVDGRGGVHVLNRDNMGMEGGGVWWKHYYRGGDGKFFLPSVLFLFLFLFFFFPGSPVYCSVFACSLCSDLC